jgi:hypothetical protein
MSMLAWQCPAPTAAREDRTRRACQETSKQPSGKRAVNKDSRDKETRELQEPVSARYKPRRLRVSPSHFLLSAVSLPFMERMGT